MAFNLPTNGLTVQFTVDNTNPDTGEVIQFTDLTNGATDWYWDFGDNTFSTLQNPTKSYNIAAEYTVTLVAWINGQIAGVRVETDYINAVNNFDPDAATFIAVAEITNVTQQIAINDLVIALKDNNLWLNMQAIYPFVGGTALSNSFNLRDVSQFQLEYRGSSGIIAHDDNGITFTGTRYASTQCVPGTGVYNRSYGEYIRVSNNNGWSGSFVGAVFGFKVDTQPQVTALGVNNLQGASINISYGYLTTSILSNTQGYLFNNNGISFTNAAPGSQPAPGVIYIGGMNQGLTNTGAPWNEYANRNLAFCHLGNGLSLAQQQTLYGIVQQYNTTLGRQV